VATRLEERRNKKSRKEEELKNISLETETELKGKESASNNKENDGATVDINPPNGKDNEFDYEIIEYDLPLSSVSR
jgi:hypothetical protein